MTLSYGSKSSSPVSNNHIVKIIQTDIANMIAIGQEKSNGPIYRINLSLYSGEIAHHPAVGEEWVIQQSMNQWVLARRTPFQNTAHTNLVNSTPGTSVFSNGGKLQFVDTQVELVGGALIVSSSVSIYQSLNNSGTSGIISHISNWSVDSVNSNNTNAFTVNSSGVFTANNNGLFALNFTVSYGSISTGRTFLEVYVTDEPFPRRISFPFDSYGYLGAVLNLSVGDTLQFNTFCTNTTSSQNFNCRVELIGLV